MPIETASFFLPDATPMMSAARLLRSLAASDLLDGGVDVLPQQIGSEQGPLAEAARAAKGSMPVASVAAALEATTSSGEKRTVDLYFRLPSPSKLPSAWRDELRTVSGHVEPDPGDLWVTHPFECWIRVDLGDVDGARLAGLFSTRRQVPHPVLPPPVRLFHDQGDPVDVKSGLELRTQPPNASYLLLALAKAGVLAGRDAVFLRVLD